MDIGRTENTSWDGDYMKYVLIQKIIQKITDECETSEIYVSDDALEVLSELKRNLDIHKSWGEIVTMTDGGSFVSETCENVYIYAMTTKKDPIKQIF